MSERDGGVSDAVDHSSSDGVLADLVNRVRKHCSDMGGCWVWEGGMDHLQPIMWVPDSGGCKRVRQLLWMALHGEISSKGLACKFGTHACVCPRHLEQQSHQKAIKLGLKKSPQGRALQRKKLQSIRSSFTDEQLAHIRQAVLTQSAYASMYGCHRTTISRIQNMRSHQPVSSPFAGLFSSLIPRS